MSTQSQSINVGDKIRRKSEYPTLPFIEGKIYTVTEIRYEWGGYDLKVDDTNINSWWYMNRFELVETENSKVEFVYTDKPKGLKFSDVEIGGYFVNTHGNLAIKHTENSAFHIADSKGKPTSFSLTYGFGEIIQRLVEKPEIIKF
jgi:hypothetical protein